MLVLSFLIIALLQTHIFARSVQKTDGRYSAALRRRTARVHEEANPEELAGKFEGDIDLPPTFNPRHRNALANKGQLWPNGIVYYTISDSFAQSKKNTIMAAMQEIMDVTKVGSSKCIQYIQRTTQQDYINIQPLRGCYSSVGRIGYDQDLSLGSGCERKGTAMHELLHALGFFHEQSRADRDDFVTVHFENILPGRANNFDKYTLGTQVDHLNQPYDYGSIMHYSRLSFSKDGSSPTLTPKQGGVRIGQRIALSPTDIKMIQLLYGCTVGTGPVSPGAKVPVSINSGAQCVDKLDNCLSYGKGACTGSYEAWARTNCERFCGYCKCDDKITTCNQYSKSDVCFGSYKPWALENCPKFCGYCDDVKPIDPADCKDKIDNCKAYGTASCTGDYEPWARENCLLTCQYCKPAVTKPKETCADKLDNCDGYGTSGCIGDYEPWARDKCALTCGYCTADTTTTTAPPPAKCEDKRNDCKDYPASACVGDYEPWARDKCALTCGYCTGVTTTTTSVPPVCKDELSNCNAYGKGSCGGDYEPWARQRCAKYCGYCYDPHGTIAPAVGTGSCKDERSDCKNYGQSACSGSYEPWARANCAAFCGLCQTTTTPTTVTTASSCRDVLEDCHAYGKSACYGDFEPWARVNCAVFCGYCGDSGVAAVTKTLPGATTPSTLTKCEDKRTDCKDYSSSACVGDYESWARDNCALTCGYCIAVTTTTTTTTTTSAPPACQDAINNCQAFGSSACKGDYEPWARTNCPAYCGFCKQTNDFTTTLPPAPCEDKLPNCIDYGKSSCTGQFEPWARDKCAKYCGYCSNALFPSTTCDFNKDLCGWKNSVEDTLDWRRRSSPTPTYATGPNADYEGGGHYLYVEASGNSNKVAKLVSSRSYPSDTPVCVRFASHMYGSNMGSLRIAATGDNFYFPLVQLQGDKGNQWTMNNVNLSVSGRSFKIAFEAIVGNGPRSDLAIDNISVEPGKCT